MDSTSRNIVAELTEKCWLHFYCNDEVLSDLCMRLVAKNEGLQYLFHRTLEIFRQLAAAKNEKIARQCCISLHLCSVVISHLSATASQDEIRSQLNLGTDFAASSLIRSPVLMLVDEALSALSASPLKFSWQYDVAYFSANFLLCCVSAQLYQLDPGVSASRSVSSGGVFMEYIYSQSERDLLNRLSRRRADCDLSDTTPGRLVKGLMRHLLDCSPPPSGSTVEALFAAVAAKVERTEKKGPNNPSYRAGEYDRLVGNSHHFGGNANSRAIILEGLELSNAVRLFVLGSFVALLNMLNIPRLLFSFGQKAAITEPMAPANEDANAFGRPVLRLLPSAPLAEKCLSFLLILLHNRGVTPVSAGSGDSSYSNPIETVFCLLQDESLVRPVERDAGAKAVDALSRIEESRGRAGPRPLHLDLMALCLWLERSVPGQGPALLLYSLLQAHPSFLAAAISAGYVGNLLSSLLKGLYTLDGGTRGRSRMRRRRNYSIKTKAKATVESMGCVDYPVSDQTELDKCARNELDHLYTLVVCILMIVSNRTAQRLLPSLSVFAPWYRERAVSKIRVVDLLLLCVLRTVMHAVFRLDGDNYLLSTCYAILLNLAPLVANIHVYTAERLVTVVVGLCAKVIAEGSEVAAAEGGERELEPMRETLTVLLQFIDACLRPQKRTSNVDLVYALVHDYDRIVPALQHTAVAAAVAGAKGSPATLPADMALLIEHYYQQLEKQEMAGRGASVGGVFNSSSIGVTALHALIAREQEHAQRGGAGGTVLADSTASYCYEEGSDPESFFVPAAWTCALHCSPDIRWFMHLQSVALFDPFGEGLLEEPTHTFEGHSGARPADTGDDPV